MPDPRRSPSTVSQSSPSKARLRRLCETLILAFAGGGGATALGVPAGWLTGSMLVVSLAAILRRPLLVPLRLARAMFLLTGIAIGAVVTPETIRGMATWPLSILMLASAMLCIIAGTSWYLRRVHALDPLSALFASFPGALAQVIALSAHSSADLRAIAVIQSLRVLLLTLGLPYVMALFGGVAGVARGAAPHPPGPAYELAILFLACGLVALLLKRLRFPGGPVIHAMIPSALLHGSGLIGAVLPGWVVIGLMVMMGAITGSRFANTDLGILRRLFAAALGSFAVGTGIAAVFAITAAMVLEVRIADVVLAFAPGAVDAMMLLALALGLDPIYIGAHHVARVVIVSLCLPLFVRIAQRRRSG